MPENVRDADVWTSLGSCGVSFLKGETYLVYADRTESGRWEVGACSRTIRLTDAGQDLAYLHFIKSGGEAVARVYGFVTNNEADLRAGRLPLQASSPVPNLVIELRSPEKMLLASTDKNGEFAFDGLAPGDYTLNVLDDLDGSRPLTEPRRIRISNEKCLEQPVYVKRSNPKP